MSIGGDESTQKRTVRDVFDDEVEKPVRFDYLVEFHCT